MSRYQAAPLPPGRRCHWCGWLAGRQRAQRTGRAWRIWIETWIEDIAALVQRPLRLRRRDGRAGDRRLSSRLEIRTPSRHRLRRLLELRLRHALGTRRWRGLRNARLHRPQLLLQLLVAILQLFDLPGQLAHLVLDGFQPHDDIGRRHLGQRRRPDRCGKHNQGGKRERISHGLGRWRDAGEKAPYHRLRCDQIVTLFPAPFAYSAGLAAADGTFLRAARHSSMR
jgi:hypothetical protein